MTKGRESYWYPFLRQLPQVNKSDLWTEEDFKTVDDLELVQPPVNVDQQMIDLWKDFKNILLKYPLVFPNKFVDIDLFISVYS